MLDSLQKNMVSAQVLGEGCCAVTKTGNTCQTTMLADCNEDFQSAPTNCENTEFCEPGCCISPENGLCNRKTSRVDCEQTGGKFERGELCNVQECRKGCCTVVITSCTSAMTDIASSSRHTASGTGNRARVIV